MAERVAVTWAYANFARERAAILLGEGLGARPRPRPSAAVEAALRRIAEPRAAARFARRWRAVREADCAAYAVPDCADRLDAAFRRMLDGWPGDD